MPINNELEVVVGALEKKTLHELSKVMIGTAKYVYLRRVLKILRIQKKSLNHNTSHWSRIFGMPKNVEYVSAMLDCIITADNLVIQKHLKSMLKNHICPFSPTIIMAHGGNTWIRVSTQTNLDVQEYSSGLIYSHFCDSVSKLIEYKNFQRSDMQPEQIVYYFPSGTAECIVSTLTEMGIVVVTKLSDIKVLRQFKTAYMLDVGALYTMVSFTTNGANANTVFTKNYMNVELERSTGDNLQNIIQSGAMLYASQIVMDIFKSCLEIHGGEGEKIRAKDIYSRIKIVDDHVSEQFQKLLDKKLITEQYAKIFGTAHAYKMCIITNNMKFANICFEQKIPIDIHPIGVCSLSEKFVCK